MEHLQAIGMTHLFLAVCWWSPVTCQYDVNTSFACLATRVHREGKSTGCLFSQLFLTPGISLSTPSVLSLVETLLGKHYLPSIASTSTGDAILFVLGGLDVWSELWAVRVRFEDCPERQMPHYSHIWCHTTPPAAIAAKGYIERQGKLYIDCGIWSLLKFCGKLESKLQRELSSAPCMGPMEHCSVFCFRPNEWRMSASQLSVSWLKEGTMSNTDLEQFRSQTMQRSDKFQAECEKMVPHGRLIMILIVNLERNFRSSARSTCFGLDLHVQR